MREKEETGQVGAQSKKSQDDENNMQYVLSLKLDVLRYVVSHLFSFIGLYLNKTRLQNT